MLIKCLGPGCLFLVLSVSAVLIKVFDTFLFVATRYIIHRS